MVEDIETGHIQDRKVSFSEDEVSPPVSQQFRPPTSDLNAKTTDRRAALQWAQSRFNIATKSPSCAIRSRKRVDGETGRNGIEIECKIVDVTGKDRTPQRPMPRRWKKMRASCCMWNRSRDENPDEEGDRQYRFKTSREYSWRHRLRNFSGADNDDEDLFRSSWSVAGLITMYLNWTFRASFCTLFLQFACTFWVLTILFAIPILIAGHQQPVCLQVGSVDVSHNTTHSYLDAYALSWQTFSTVGYGLIYPQVSSASLKYGEFQCIGINLLMSIEAFNGLLYIAVCGAIILGKTVHVQSFANVVFSHPLVIKYGTGLSTKGADETDEEKDENIPFPILEFRLVNNHHGGRGEIINATVKCCAVINENKASDAVLLAAGVASSTTQSMREEMLHKEVTSILSSPIMMARAGIQGLGHLRKNLSKALPNMRSAPGPESAKKGKSLQSERPIKEDAKLSPLKTRQNVSQSRNHQCVLQEGLFLATGDARPAIIDEGSDLVPRRIFSQMELKNGTHPAFKRSWIVSHVLNEQSPLLKGKARKLIADNGGKWPAELNSYNRIRESIGFHEIIVSFTGVSNATGATVYAQKVYDFSNVNIGYAFASVLYLNHLGILSADSSLINDVVEQRGGGGEPFDHIESNLLDELPGLNQVFDAVVTVGRSTKREAGIAVEHVEDAAGQLKDGIVTVADAVKEKLHTVADRARHNILERRRQGEAGNDAARDNIDAERKSE